MITVLIVDDEPRASNLLKNNITHFIPEITTVLIANSAEEGLAIIKEQRPQLIFLDIEMPKMNGFEMLNQITEWNFDVIFTTAFNQYAIKAIRYSALDYLLKPIDGNELRNAFDHFIQQTRQHISNAGLYKNLIKNLEQKDEQHFKLSLSSTDGNIFIDVNDIVRCEADSNYTIFYFSNQKKWVATKTLKEYDEILCNRGFVRVHKSHLVNKNFVQKIMDTQLILKDNTPIEIARRRRHEVATLLGF